MSLIIGITGTRHGMSPAQKLRLEEYLEEVDVVELHHGGCVGADHDAHLMALEKFIRVVVHPPTDLKLAAHDTLTPSDMVTVLPAKDYHSRDRDIVDVSNVLLGFPDRPERPHSGTWYTIRYARNRRKSRIVCMPDGSMY